jgi:signal transduction histidine kinase
MKKNNIPSFRTIWLYQWFVFLFFLILAVWAFITFDLDRLYKHTDKENHIRTSNLTHLYAEEVASSINLIDFVTRDLRDHWDGDSLEYAAFVQRRQVALDPSIAFHVSIVDDKGKLIFSNADWKLPDINVSDRESFMFHRKHRLDELHISAPTIGRTFNRWAVLFTRPLTTSPGSFKGLIAVAVSPEYFSRFHQRIDFGPGSSISLVRRADGKLIARYPSSELALGNRIASAPFMEPDAPANGHFLKRSEVDEVERLYSWHTLEDIDLTVVVGQSTETMYEQYHHQRKVYLWTGLVITLVFMTIGLFIYIYYRRREEELMTLQAMEKALQRSQKLEAVGKMTGGIAHDFNNILQIISGNMQMMQAKTGDNPELEQRLKSSIDAVDHGTRLVSQLLSFARRKPLKAQLVHAGERLNKIHSMLQRLVGDAIELHIRFADDLWQIRVDPDLMENVILNLAANARDAMNGQGWISIELTNETIDTFEASSHPDMLPGQYVRISVNDNGSGMPAEVIDHAFEPFFTTKPEGKGTGLGLSMAYGFVRQSGGYIYIVSHVGQGTTIEIFLPRSSKEETGS